MVTAGVKGILITVADAKAENAGDREGEEGGRDRDRARLADRARRPPSNALFATNNLNAGILIGKYARAATKGKTVTIAMLDEHAGLVGRGAPSQRLPRRASGSRTATSRSSASANGGGRHARIADRDGELPPEEPGHQRRLHDQRAERRRRLDGAEERRQDAERRHDRLRRRRLRAACATSRRASSTRPRSSTRC